jgi:hypothetical protein
MISASIILNGVDHINRRGIGDVYRGVVTLTQLYKALRKGNIRYAPKYQRGFKLSQEDIPEENYNLLFDLDDPDLNIDEKRVQQMAIKFLEGRLFTTDILWNARIDDDFEEPVFEEEKAQLAIDTVLTIPDSGHRHKAYYRLVEWYNNNDKIPNKVIVDGTPIYKDKILELFESFNPSTESVNVTIYALSPEDEGRLYDEFNTEGKKPSTATAIDMNPESTPSRRFLKALTENCKIFSREELETRRNTIGSKSRKLTTNSTIESALKSRQKFLVEVEKSKESYDDLVNFTSSFFIEWAYHFSAFQPEATADERWTLRNESFALSNIIFFPLIELAFDLWNVYHKNSIDWSGNEEWKIFISRLASKVEVELNGKVVKVPIMSRENPAWKGKILVQSLDKKGNESWTLSSTRNTRKSAYQYLSTVGNKVDLEKKLKS